MQTDAPLILAKLRAKLIDNYTHDLQAESAELYYHIEKTLIAALKEHYEQETKEDKGEDRANTRESEEGHN